MASKETLGLNVRKYRQRLGLTQEQLAEKAQLTSRTLISIEGAEGSNVELETLDLLAKALGTNPDALINPKSN